MLQRWIIFIVLFSSISLNANFNPVFHNENNTKPITINQHIIKDAVTEDELKAQAAVWGLSVDDWQDYQVIMQGVGGVLYSHLLPIEVLVIMTDDMAQRNRYLDIAVEQLKQHVERVLAYEVDIKQRLLASYSDLPILTDFDVKPFSPLSQKRVNVKSGDRLLLFTKIHNPANWGLVGKLLNLVNTHEGVFLDIYIIDADNVAVQTWAKQHNIPLDLVHSNVINLDHDDGSLLRKKVGHVRDLPSILLFDGVQSHLLSVYDL